MSREASMLKAERQRAMRAAKELFYGDYVVNAIEKAMSIKEITDIMQSARRYMMESEAC